MNCPKSRLTVECCLQPRIALSAVDVEHVLGESCFSIGAASCTALHAKLPLGLTGLDEDSRGETWISSQIVDPGVYGDIAFSRTEHALFGCVSRQIADSRQAFQDTVYKTYEDIFDLLDKSKMRRLVRMWNSFPRINEVIEGLERYQQFTVSRYNAFEKHYGEFIDRLPAATAVGGKGDRLSVYFIATDLNPIHCENSRQVCAYEYPDQYGPRSPSFSRATLQHWPDGESFYISGTASIVGHESRHIGDVAAQLDESLNNVEILINDAAKDHGAGFNGLESLSMLKVYVRNSSDYGIIKTTLEKRLPPSIPVACVEADICRRELLVEVEGLIQR